MSLNEKRKHGGNYYESQMKEGKVIRCENYNCSNPNGSNVRYERLRKGGLPHCNDCVRAFICKGCDVVTHINDENSSSLYTGYCNDCTSCCGFPIWDYVCGKCYCELD